MPVDIESGTEEALKLEQTEACRDNEHEIDEIRDESDQNETGVQARLGPTEEAGAGADGEAQAPKPALWKRISWKPFLVYGVLPVLALLLASGAGYFKWQDSRGRLSELAATQALQVATDSTIAMLSYRPDTVEKELTAATNRMTGTFRDDYTKLINQIVIPGSKEKKISAQATVPAAAAIAATVNHAVVLAYVNQTTTIGADPPTNTASSVRITLNKVGDRWLISQFDPI